VTGHETRIVGDEKQGAAGDVDRLTQPAQRGILAQIAAISSSKPARVMPVRIASGSKWQEFAFWDRKMPNLSIVL
jgi:hypothetical protein